MEKRSTPSLQITDRFGAQAAFASLRLPDGTEATIPAEHAAAIYVNGTLTLLVAANADPVRVTAGER